MLREKNVIAENNEPIKTIELSEKEIQLFENWKEDYKTWQERSKNTERINTIRTQKSTVRDISMLLVGLALFLSHGKIVIREKNKD